jgi:signal peptidase I
MVIMKYWKNDCIAIISLFVVCGYFLFALSFVLSLLLMGVAIQDTLDNKGQLAETYNNEVNPDLRKYVPFGYIEGYGSSMEPTLCSGSEIWYKDGKIERGDIVVFDSGSNGIVIHRTVRETENGWLTKGDNNNYIDQKVDLGNNYANESTTIGIVTSYKSNCNN